MFQKNNNYATSVSCINGGIHKPILDWFKTKYGMTNIDIITEPGVDKHIHNHEKMNEIKTKVAMSINNHGSRLILISAHHDCTGHPTTDEKHIEDVTRMTKHVRTWWHDVQVFGAFIDKDLKLKIIDTS